LHHKSILFSGTKDKRAVTLQRMAIKGIDARQIAGINKVRLYRYGHVAVGDFTTVRQGLSLGGLSGNHFTIILRHIQTDSGTPPADDNTSVDVVLLDEVRQALDAQGFANFFGPQRFGTTRVLTSDIGLELLKENYRLALERILESRIDISPEVADAVAQFKAMDYDAALAAMPGYCFQERDALKHLVKAPGDVKGAVLSLPRPLAMMYAHSVQSLVWNRILSQRLLADGPSPCVGDLVLAESAATISGEVEDAAMDDIAAAEAGVEGPGEAVERDAPAQVTSILPKVRCVTQDDLDSGTVISLSQIVLPVPGPDEALRFPERPSCSKAAYVQVASALGVENALFGSPDGDLVRRLHFHGTYRHAAVRPAHLAFEPLQIADAPVYPEDVVKWIKEEEPVNPTTTSDGPEQKRALRVTFSLPRGSYATSLLREFCVVAKTPQDVEHQQQ